MVMFEGIIRFDAQEEAEEVLRRIKANNGDGEVLQIPGSNPPAYGIYGVGDRRSSYLTWSAEGPELE